MEGIMWFQVRSHKKAEMRGSNMADEREKPDQESEEEKDLWRE